MKLLHGVGDFFSLDIGTNSMRIVQLSGNAQRGWSLVKYAYVPVDQKLVQDSSELGKKRLGEAIVAAVNQAGIKTKNIALGLPSSKSFTSIVETDTLPEKELEKAFKYEIDKYVPMAMNDAQADYIVLGPSPNDANKTEVLVASTAKEYAEAQLELVEKAGFNVVAMEPEVLAMARALTPVGMNDAVLLVDFGEHSTDLAIVYQGKPRLVRTIPWAFGLITKTAASSLNVKEEQARQFILKFGLAQDKVEGQVFKVLDGLLDNFAAELVKSIRFFQTRYLNAKVSNISLAGFAETVPLFPEYIEAKTQIPTMRANPWQSVRLSTAQQQALVNVSSEFPVAIGLAKRSND
ncbi:MAG: type IV pilus assembly protein PilM [Candidatus Saccharibacteria bacterium]|nr:type IV pilus assembly protein PilM [Candidatus Saccharibacteria bacterium]